MSDEEQPPRDELTRLDPDAAAPQRPADDPPAERTEPAEPAGRAERAGAPEFDVRPYRWAVGVIGLLVLIAFSVYQLGHHGRASTGVPAGQRLHWFAAPLADSNLDGDPNLHPECTLAGHDPRALNLCLDAHRSAVVLAFFVPRAGRCVRQVDALQTLSRRFAGARVTFAAVAVHSSHRQIAALVRAHGWTIPVAYDADGSVGGQYGVVACPMVELAARGGVVRDRLIGERWQSVAALEPRVAALLGSTG